MANRQNAKSIPRLSDEELEYYGDLYVRCGIREAGVDFESFLNNLDYYLQKHARGRQALRESEGNGDRKGLTGFLRLRQATWVSSK